MRSNNLNELLFNVFPLKFGHCLAIRPSRRNVGASCRKEHFLATGSISRLTVPAEPRMVNSALALTVFLARASARTQMDRLPYTVALSYLYYLFSP